MTIRHFIPVLLMATLGSNISVGEVNWENNPVGAVFAREGGESPAGTFRLVSDGIEVYTIVSVDQAEFYQPASLFYGADNADKAKVDALAPSGRVASSMNCFLVRLDGHNMLFDTGLPAERGGKILDRLASLNVSSDNIETIFITHGHFDHIGGLIEAGGKANFPNATLYVAAEELKYIESATPDFAEDMKKAYGNKIVTFAPGSLLPYHILPIDAAGHTPGQVVYRLGKLLFAGDILHGMAVQLIDPTICANFDMDKAKAIKTRESIMRYAAANSLTVLCAHVPNNGVLF